MRARVTAPLGSLVLASCTLVAAGPTPVGVGRPAPGAPAPAPKDAAGPRSDVPPPAPAKGGPYSQRGSHVTGDNVFLPVSSAPAHPYAGVLDGKPVVLVLDDHWWIRDESLPCTAARDHCLPAQAWFWVPDDVSPTPVRRALPMVFTAGGPRRPGPVNPVGPEPYVAYRTVPATKQHAVAGARAIVFPDQPYPQRGDHVYNTWHTGIVDRVDLDLEMVFLRGDDAAYPLTATRIAVLAYRPGKPIEILDGKRREDLAVSPADLFVP